MPTSLDRPVQLRARVRTMLGLIVAACLALSSTLLSAQSAHAYTEPLAETSFSCATGWMSMNVTASVALAAGETPPTVQWLVDGEEWDVGPADADGTWSSGGGGEFPPGTYTSTVRIGGDVIDETSFAFPADCDLADGGDFPVTASCVDGAAQVTATLERTIASGVTETYWPSAYDWQTGEMVDFGSVKSLTGPGGTATFRGSLPAGWFDIVLDTAVTGPGGGFGGSLSATVEVPTCVRTFSDVPPGLAFHDDIMWLAERGVTTGYSDGTFRPLSSVNRDAMAAFLYRYSGSPAFTAPEDPTFSDVAADNGFYKEIEWLAASGIATGWNDGTFRPLEPVARDAMAAYLYRLADRPAFEAPAVSPFRDVGTDNGFFKEITWLSSTGVTTGWSDGTFRPLDSVNRDAMAAFLHRFDASVLGAG